MEYLKKHKVAFHGFPWEHPLRIRWRGLGKPDPITSVHPLIYINKELWLTSIMATAFSLSLPLIFPLFWGSICAGLFILLVIPRTLRLGCIKSKDSGRQFIAAMEKLAEALNLDLSELAQSSRETLMYYAHAALMINAADYQRAEKENPNPFEREATLDSFDRHFWEFDKWKLLVDLSRDRYFTKTR